MEYKKLKDFPSDFMWGGSSAAFQYEGAYLEDGKSLNIMDVVKPLEGKADTSVTSDHYHRYKEDVQLMKELGLTSYRFSISWARVLPEGGDKVNQKGIDFYNDLIDELVKNDITPIVTLYHFDSPLCLTEQYNGWASRAMLKDFEFFCRLVFSEFGDRVKYWLTINEQSTILYFPKFVGAKIDEDNEDKWRYKVSHNFSLGHALAVKLCREIVEDCKIGPAIGWNAAYPETNKPEDVLASLNRDVIQGYAIMDVYVKGKYNPIFWNYLVDRGVEPEVTKADLELLAQGKPDFIALNYYRTATVKASSIDEEIIHHRYNQTGKKGDIVFPNIPGAYQECPNTNLEVNDWDWPIDPTGFRITLRRVYERYELPMMITENGYGAYDTLTVDGQVNDDYRIDYIEKHLHAIREAISDGVEMISYNPWSFMDLLSTSNGFEKRYGFVYVNRTENDLLDLKRIKKKSFYWYQKVIAENGNNI